MTVAIDLTRADVPLWRLVVVELRKAVDTRAGLWLLISIGIITLLWDLFWLSTPQEVHTFTAFLAAPAILQKPLLGILGILLATSEWSQRTAMVTFTLVPKRGNTVLAKIAAALLLSTLAFAVGLVIAAVLATVGGASDPWDLPLGTLGQAYLGTLISTLQGIAFGLLLLNTPAAIVVYLLASTVVSAVTGLVDALRDLAPWVDFSGAMRPLVDDVPGALTSEQWGHLISATIIWFVIPFAIGIWRVLNAEVK
ncbi:MAG TPA: ABC transporter permease [Aeromicrobium sp.]|nr:ABC transporter permease [Aeromicrobium sp.]